MDWAAVFWAGFLATVLMIAVMYLVRLAGPALALTTLLGSLVLPEPRDPKTETLGYLVLLGAGSTLVAALYAWLLSAAGGASLLRGALLGLLNGLVLAAALPLLGTISASVRSRALPPPGRFGADWGRWTPVALVLGHLVYGGVLALVLANFGPR